MIDLRVSNHGSIWLLEPVSAVGQEWVDDWLPVDFNGAVEPRYIDDLIIHARDEGLEVEIA